MADAECTRENARRATPRKQDLVETMLYETRTKEATLPPSLSFARARVFIANVRLQSRDKLAKRLSSLDTPRRRARKIEIMRRGAQSRVSVIFKHATKGYIYIYTHAFVPALFAALSLIKSRLGRVRERDPRPPLAPRPLADAAQSIRPRAREFNGGS